MPDLLVPWQCAMMCLCLYSMQPIILHAHICADIGSVFMTLRNQQAEGDRTDCSMIPQSQVISSVYIHVYFSYTL